MARVNEAIEMGGSTEVHRPERLNPTKGTTTYPFAELAVGAHFYVKRTPGSVRVALRRWLELHKSEKRAFDYWMGKNAKGERCVVVKRTK